jgi:hypothetical protein
MDLLGGVRGCLRSRSLGGVVHSGEITKTKYGGVKLEVARRRTPCPVSRKCALVVADQ